MIINDAIEEIVENVLAVSAEINKESIYEMMEILTSSKKVFLLGQGRSGLVARAFAMRLMHLGINVYVVGETITPTICEEDCFLAISGSGETSYIISTAKIAKIRGSKIVAVTSYDDSTLGEMSDLFIHIKGRTKVDSEKNYTKRQMNGKHLSLSPLGTLFEVSTLIFLDALIAQLMDKLGKTEDDLKKRHTVLE
ncbi:MAG: 6-phospho-3-hexuloisomerase [Methanobacterium sp.]|nr:6-phospho-3-hexuloisomerase [Methanobacterium sp.]